MSKKLTQEEFEEKVKQVHGDKYDFSQFIYIGSKLKSTVICHKHGLLKKTPNALLRGQGCRLCGIEETAKKKIEKAKKHFKEKATKVHSGKYKEYGEYIRAKAPIPILCPIHGWFQQTPNDHLNGQGCPHCKESKLEKNIRHFLDEHNIVNIPQSSKKDLHWLGKLSLDFYLPDYNVAIECQGKQHFIEGCTFGGNETLGVIQERDQRKLRLCQENGVKLLYYSNLGINYPYHVYENGVDLLNEIKNQ